MLQNTEPRVITEAELKQRFVDLSEIYNEEMSATRVEVGIDQSLHEVGVSCGLKLTDGRHQAHLQG